jgi:hypothetical protein
VSDPEQTDPHLRLQRSTLLSRAVGVVQGLRNMWLAVVRRLTRTKRTRPRELRILITGATTGIGYATAQALVREGVHTLVLTGRASSLARLDAFKHAPRVMVLPLDVTSATDRDAVYVDVEAKLGGLDVLINNAGISFRSVVEHVTEAERLLQLDVNYLAPMALTRLFLPGMRAQQFGKIINLLGGRHDGDADDGHLQRVEVCTRRRFGGAVVRAKAVGYQRNLGTTRVRALRRVSESGAVRTGCGVARRSARSVPSPLLQHGGVH